MITDKHAKWQRFLLGVYWIDFVFHYIYQYQYRKYWHFFKYLQYQYLASKKNADIANTTVSTDHKADELQLYTFDQIFNKNRDYK